MTPKNSTNYTSYNKEGLIPGPNETEAEFLQRVEFCLHLRENWETIEQKELPFEIDDSAAKEILESSNHKTDVLYGISPTWVPIFFSNFKLPPWLGGCAWIFQLTETTPTSAFLQLRSAFKRNKCYLGIYDRKELLAHELSHVGRMMYQEPRYEEFFAYQSSPSFYRKWIGPLFQSSRESFFFVLLLALMVIVNVGMHSYGWVNALPVLYIAFALLRVGYNYRQLSQAEKKLGEVLGDSQKTRHLLYRLTDKEIVLFSRKSPLQIKEYMQKETVTSFRWQFLMSIYTSS